MKRAIISTGKYLILLLIGNSIGFWLFPDRFNLFNVICCTAGSLLGIFIVDLIDEKKKEKNKKLHF